MPTRQERLDEIRRIVDENELGRMEEIYWEGDDPETPHQYLIVHWSGDLSVNAFTMPHDKVEAGVNDWEIGDNVSGITVHDLDAGGVEYGVKTTRATFHFNWPC